MKSPAMLTGVVHVANKHGHFRSLPKPGGILVIDIPDLNVEVATLLISHHPSAVLNVAQSSTGRDLALGTPLLVDAGVTVLDDLGTDLLALNDGETISVSAYTGEVIRGEELIASGTTVDVAAVEQIRSGGRQRLAAKVQAQALSVAQDFTAEQSLIVDGTGLPESKVRLEGRIVLVVSSGFNMKRLRRFIGDHNPVVIAVGRAIAELPRHRLRAAVFVGDPQDVEASALQRVSQVVIPTSGEEIPGRLNLKRHSIDYDAVTTSLSARDVALLFAGFNGASAIVDCQNATTFTESLDRPGLQATGSALVSAALSNRLVSATAVLALYRPVLPAWWLVLLIIAAVLAGASALVFTPWGASLAFMPLLSATSRGNP